MKKAHIKIIHWKFPTIKVNYWVARKPITCNVVHTYMWEEPKARGLAWRVICSIKKYSKLSSIRIQTFCSSWVVVLIHCQKVLTSMSSFSPLMSSTLNLDFLKHKQHSTNPFLSATEHRTKVGLLKRIYKGICIHSRFWRGVKTENVTSINESNEIRRRLKMKKMKITKIKI